MAPAWNDRTSTAERSVERASADGLAWKMGEFAQLLQQERSEKDVLTRLAQTAIDMIPGAQEASIVRVAGRKFEPRCASGPLALRADELQALVGQGPCFDAAAQDPVVQLRDLEEDSRWPEFTLRARALGLGSMMAFRLFVATEDLGTLNLYSATAGAFDEESAEVGLLVAAHASVVLAETRESDQLRGAATSRDVIGQAKGILMERFKISAAHAFVLLARVSSDTNTKLVHVAAHLARTGELPRKR